MALTGFLMLINVRRQMQKIFRDGRRKMRQVFFWILKITAESNVGYTEFSNRMNSFFLLRKNFC